MAGPSEYACAAEEFMLNVTRGGGVSLSQKGRRGS